MADPRIQKLAQVLVRYSLDLQPGEEFFLQTTPLAEELNLAVYKEALLAGAHPFVINNLPGQDELFFKYAGETQLEYIPPITRIIIEHYRAWLDIQADENTRALTNVDSSCRSRVRQARSGLFKKKLDRIFSGELKWCATVYPTQALAQEADMSLSEYQDFVYTAGLLDLPDPVAAWRGEAARQQRLMAWLKGKNQVILRGKDVDLRLSIQDRLFDGAAGKLNFPDGEIFTSPVEESVNGWIRFAYPGIFSGQEVVDIELWFENGKVVHEQAAKGQELLTDLLNTDPGARYLGEWGIGTNYAIPRFTKNMLFDEKLGGTLHLAVGLGFHELGGKNESGLHWDMLCDMSESEILVDGELFYKDGQFVVVG